MWLPPFSPFAFFLYLVLFFLFVLGSDFLFLSFFFPTLLCLSITFDEVILLREVISFTFASLCFSELYSPLAAFMNCVSTKQSFQPIDIDVFSHFSTVPTPSALSDLFFPPLCCPNSCFLSAALLPPPCPARETYFRSHLPELVEPHGPFTGAGYF